jgi:hypothetical protein
LLRQILSLVRLPISPLPQVSPVYNGIHFERLFAAPSGVLKSKRAPREWDALR